MSFRITLAVAAASLAITGIVYTSVAQEPTTAPTSAPALTRPLTKSGKPRALTLVKPWKDVKDLTEDQKIQIFMIHQETKDKIDGLMQEEQSKCMALLSDAQKAGLNDTMGSAKVAEKKADAK